MAKFKEYILEQYDDNCDGKISMTEVSKDINKDSNRLARVG